MTEAACRILILEDIAAVGDRMAQILRDWDHAEVLPVCRTVHDALRVIRRSKVDILIADLNLPDGMGTTAIRELRKVRPDAQAIVMTVLNDASVVLEAIQAGATGYIIKDDPSIGVVHAIETILAGESPMSAGIARLIVEAMQANGQPRVPTGTETDQVPNLTPRETDVLKAIARGFSHREVAEMLGISPQTVPVHTRNIYRKLEATTKTEAVFVAQQRGLIPQ
jgi:DNA-binding NarL/FixJ family response regulator